MIKCLFSHQSLKPLKRELDKTVEKQKIQQLYAKIFCRFQRVNVCLPAHVCSLDNNAVLFCILIHKVPLGQSNPCLLKQFMENIALTHLQEHKRRGINESRKLIV